MAAEKTMKIKILEACIIEGEVADVDEVLVVPERCAVTLMGMRKAELHTEEDE